jgi:CRISPR type I-E-associated protein CasB/Cse2
MNDERYDVRQRAIGLLAYLRQLKDDRGAMAELRRALNPAQRHRAWPLLARVGGIGNPRIEAVAGLFAYHPDETTEGNLGTTCRLLLRGEKDTFDARFRRILSCDREEICERLRPIIFAAKSRGIGVNYEELLTDLCYWGDSVKARWAKEYWDVPRAENPAGTATAETSA